MNDQNDFSALRNLLALQRQDFPQDTQVEEFLTEFHRRQRATLLVRRSLWNRSVAWAKERMAGLELAPSLSYATVTAAIALTAFLGLSQQVSVTHADGQTRFSFHMPVHQSSFALVSGNSLLSSVNVSSKLSDSPNFTPGRSDSAATRYVLANSNPGNNDATVAF